MSRLQGTRTEANLRFAILDEAAAKQICLSRAQAADARGCPGLAAVLRARADAGAGYVAAHLDDLVASRTGGLGASPASTATNSDITTPIMALTAHHMGMYAGMARTAEEEGFDEIADWFRTLATAGPVRIRKLRQTVGNLADHDSAERGSGRRM